MSDTSEAGAGKVPFMQRQWTDPSGITNVCADQKAEEAAGRLGPDYEEPEDISRILCCCRANY